MKVSNISVSVSFLPTVPGGGTMGLQMDFFCSSYSSSSSSTPPTWGTAKTTCPCGEGGIHPTPTTVLYCIVLYCTVQYCTVKQNPPPKKIPPPKKSPPKKNHTPPPKKIPPPKKKSPPPKKKEFVCVLCIILCLTNSICKRAATYSDSCLVITQP